MINRYISFSEMTPKILRWYRDYFCVIIVHRVPKTKNQKDYATTVTYKEFISTGAEKPKIVKSGGVSVGTALLILLIGLVCIFLMFKALM